MDKVITKNFGVKSILNKERLDNTNYYWAQIGENKYDLMYRIDGIINADGKEIIPFGEMSLMRSIRVINSNTFIIDNLSRIGKKGVSKDIHGSKLYQVNNDETKLLCESNACRMKVVNDYVLGANYVDDLDNDLNYIEKYLYDLNNCNIKEVSRVNYSTVPKNQNIKHLIKKKNK
ncbi:MAG: hypothetical protein PHO63_01075 [Bacilli bacterium]|nr:hypothetical protein [Bacilli bacterium]MDD4808512.1 hypothetical protein [Bacilli bacterium]